MSDDAMSGAYRLGIRHCGEHLWRLTSSVDAMGDALERVAERDPANSGRRFAIVDAAWNGIGGAWFS